MHALRLTSRFKDEAYQGDACLLVYDVEVLTGAILSEDVRDQFDARPTTSRMYILAPFIPEQIIKTAMFEGAVFERISKYFSMMGGKIYLLTVREHDGEMQPVALPFAITNKIPNEEAPVLLDPYLRNGWLFDLFDTYKGLVDAPPGIHFGKASHRHAAKFLRTSGILLTSVACALVAYFAISVLRRGQPRRIFVDTAPLISVAFALQRIASLQNLWPMLVPVSSFSSYGGVDLLPAASSRDIVLISASTSGGLANKLAGLGFGIERIVTLFYLNSDQENPFVSPIVCNLTFRPGISYGYVGIENYSSGNCPLCKKGFFLAELEGDQFLLEKRATKELSVRTLSQPKDSRETMEALARNQIIAIPIFRNGGVPSVDFDADAAIVKSDAIRSKTVKMLRRFSPVPLHYVILVDINKRTFEQLVVASGMDHVLVGTTIVTSQEMSNLPPIVGAGVLVLLGCLSDYARVRDINAELRVIADQGCVTYLALLTLTESAEHLSSLRNFLTYGANGRDSFSFCSAYTLMLPFTSDPRSSWELEQELLLKIRDSGEGAEEFDRRLAVLSQKASRSDNIFWSGKDSELSINSDFVYLDTHKDRERITQADILITVSNLLATARSGNRGVTSAVELSPVRWQQSIYGHTVLAISNFEDYNDAILRAAFLRAASSEELNYANDERLSRNMSAILMQGIFGWFRGTGNFVPGALVALSTGRLALANTDLIDVKRAIRDSSLPIFLKVLATMI